MSRSYQHNYSDLKPYVFDAQERQKKALTIVEVCKDFLEAEDLSGLSLLDVGSSSGIIDNTLASYFGQVHGIDIDEPAMNHAKATFKKDNLSFALGDAMKLSQANDSVDVVVCSHVYEHVPDAEIMFSEIYRVLKPEGFCYFSGNNRVMIIEPHYRLPFLSLLPRPLAHLYMRITNKGEFYHEKHVSYRALLRLCSAFEIVDYSSRIIADPDRFGVSYMLKKNSLKWSIANFIARYFKWATPHIWILQKPGHATNAQHER
ncbi:MAG: class I SAM-dependent methyltransferase [Pseudomonadota bacterium]